MKPGHHIKAQVEVAIGKVGRSVGHLTYIKQGPREYTVFAYNAAWLDDPAHFAVSPDLPLIAGHQPRRAPSRVDSVFHLALADTEPDAWGRRIIARAHAKLRRNHPKLAALTELDYLTTVDDFSRVGALRLRDADGQYLRTVAKGERAAPPLIELRRLCDASRAVETGQDTEEDLQYLQGKGTSLGGMRPKCTVLDENGTLAIGKFPSVNDSRSVTRGEVLALRLAARAGIEAATARIIELDATPVAVITRFDRTPDQGRIHYWSAASLLQASRNHEHSYFEIADAIRTYCASPTPDVQQLWRRLVFNLLITNVDDHLQNHGFLSVGYGQWRLAPAFDLNPFPDKDRESKTWLSPDTGPIDSLAMLMDTAAYFSLTPDAALQVLAEVYVAVADWRTEARSAAVGLPTHELDDFASAFAHEALDDAQQRLGYPSR